LPKTGLLQTVEVRARWWSQIAFIPPACLQRTEEVQFHWTQFKQRDTDSCSQLKGWFTQRLTQSPFFFLGLFVCGFCVWFSAWCVFGLSLWLCSGAPASQAGPCSVELFLTVDSHGLQTVTHTRSLSAAVLLHVLNPLNGEPFSGWVQSNPTDNVYAKHLWNERIEEGEWKRPSWLGGNRKDSSPVGSKEELVWRARQHCKTFSCRWEGVLRWFYEMCIYCLPCSACSTVWLPIWASKRYICRYGQAAKNVTNKKMPIDLFLKPILTVLFGR